jgi:hypothetical protein
LARLRNRGASEGLGFMSLPRTTVVSATAMFANNLITSELLTRLKTPGIDIFFKPEVSCPRRFRSRLATIHPPSVSEQGVHLRVAPDDPTSMWRASERQFYGSRVARKLGDMISLLLSRSSVRVFLRLPVYAFALTRPPVISARRVAGHLETQAVSVSMLAEDHPA